MPISPNQILQQVTTYQTSALAYLENLNAFVSTMNTKFVNFPEITANLGSTVNIDLPYRFIGENGLVVNFQGITQKYTPISIDQAANVSYSKTAQDEIFVLSHNEFMEKIGKGAIAELAAKVEENIALNANSSVPVMQVVNGGSVPTGALHYESGPFRFFGDGYTAINSYQQLAQMIANFRNYGAAKGEIKVYFPDTIVPQVVGTGLAQFTPRRNDEVAQSWEIGAYGSPNVMYYSSNLLPIHYAGDVGNADHATNKNRLTVVSTNDPTGANVTQITCTCDATLADNANAIKSGDVCQFVDGVSGKPNMRFVTYTGHNVSNQQVQFRITQDSASTGTTVVLNLIAGDISFPGLCSTNTANKSMNNAIQAGMQIDVAPSHRCGLVVGGNAGFLAMPKLPDVIPYPSVSEYDPDTGVSMRMYYGSVPFQNQTGLVHDCIWASHFVPQYCMRILFPLSQ